MTKIHLCAICNGEVSREDDGYSTEIFIEDSYDGCEEHIVEGDYDL
jgi:hypothetical protein